MPLQHFSLSAFTSKPADKLRIKHSPSMRFSLCSLLLFFLWLYLAIADQILSCILFYPYGTLEEIEAEAKAVIIQSEGRIKYEYSKYLHSHPPRSAISSLRAS